MEIFTHVPQKHKRDEKVWVSRCSCPKDSKCVFIFFEDKQNYHPKLIKCCLMLKCSGQLSTTKHQYCKYYMIIQRHRLTDITLRCRCIPTELVKGEGIAYPPWSLIPRVLNQAETQEVDLLLVTPLWKAMLCSY